ncbi:polyprenyl synthetase family protein [Nocardioides sp.]|uniref:polyprenyl synthetase family protein n=1 Tax=Nocardioides sp. TaxID=35761 RepID=UPI0037844B4C
MTPRTTDEALERLLDEGAARAAAIDPEEARLWQAVAAAAEGGKRFRPALVTAAHGVLGGTDPAAAAEVGAAIELLHTALIIHDDVIDGDDVRRGRPNVSGTYTAHALAAGAAPGEAADLGHAAGILAGDLALAAAVRAVATCGAPTDVVRRLLDLVDAALHTTAAGELADVRLSLHLGSASLAESLAMEEQKTSAYSFALPLQAGAVLAGSDDGTVARLGEAGRLLGAAFQLVDDLLGVFGDPGRTGKSATSDLRTRKQTPLLLHAASTPQWQEIGAYVGRDLTDDELDTARRLLTASGSRAFVEELAAAQLAGARAVLDELGIAGDLVPAVTACLPMLAGDDAADGRPAAEKEVAA